MEELSSDFPTLIPPTMEARSMSKRESSMHGVGDHLAIVGTLVYTALAQIKVIITSFIS
jgi:hypothetical protein